MIVYRLETHPDGKSWTVEYFSNKCDAERAYVDACRHEHWDVYLDSQVVPSGRDALIEALNGADACRTAIDGITLIDKRVGGVFFKKRRLTTAAPEPGPAEGAA